MVTGRRKAGRVSINGIERVGRHRKGKKGQASFLVNE